jgi:hypothetical protein
MGWRIAIQFSTEAHIFQLAPTLRQALGSSQLTPSHIPGDLFDVITSLVSLEHGVYGWENVTSE